MACSRTPVGQGTDGVGPQNAGVANRCWPLAEALSADDDVILALPVLTRLSHEQFAVVYYNSRNIGLVARDSDVVICDTGALTLHPQLMDAGKPMAVDLAGVAVPQDGGVGADPGAGSAAAVCPAEGEMTAPGLTDVLATADFFICSTEEERRRWLSALERAGRVNPHTLDGDSGLRRLIAVVRIGDRLQPLTDYCAAPYFARDRGTRFNRIGLPKAPGKARGLAHYWRRVRYLWRTGGCRAVWSRAGAVIKRKFRGREQS